MIKIMKPHEASAYCREHGYIVSEGRLRAGLEQGVYPFGNAVKMDKQCTYEIYTALLDKWIAERTV